MQTQDVNERVRRTLSALLKVPPERLRDDSSREALEEWDSLKHMHLVLALEEEFDVEFADDEVASLATVAALTQAITGKLAARGR